VTGKNEPVAWRYPVYWWQPMAHTEWHYTHRPEAISAAAHDAGVRAEPLYTAPPDHREVMRMALQNITEELAEMQRRYEGSLRLQHAAEALRAVLGEK